MIPACFIAVRRAAKFLIFLKATGVILAPVIFQSSCFQFDLNHLASESKVCEKILRHPDNVVTGSAFQGNWTRAAKDLGDLSPVGRTVDSSLKTIWTEKIQQTYSILILVQETRVLFTSTHIVCSCLHSI